MLLHRITLENFATFASASFDLSSTFDKPVVLFTGNNGAGKTSTLEAFRLALYGRKTYASISEDEYQRILRGKFHNGNFEDEATISLAFEFADAGETHKVDLTRSWRVRRKTVTERLRLLLDGEPLEPDIAEDLISNIVPPEVLRYFFFDGEKIAELADWESTDDTALFASVNELLGLNITGQLERDLAHATERGRNAEGVSLAELANSCDSAVLNARTCRENLKVQRQALSTAQRRQEACRRKFVSLGGVFAEERATHEATLNELNSQLDAIEEATRSEAALVMPLLIAPNIFEALKDAVAKSEALEVLAVITHAIADGSAVLTERLATIVGKRNAGRVVDVVRDVLTPKPVALDHRPLDVSLREASWMRNVLIRELPALKARLSVLAQRHAEVRNRCSSVKARLELAPTDNEALSLALAALEEETMEAAIAKIAVDNAERELLKANQEAAIAEERLRKARHHEFRTRRLNMRDSLAASVLELLPTLAQRIRNSKESRFSALLLQSLNQLWHKEGRLKSVVVDLAMQSIDLYDAMGKIEKRNLSAAEKQLFAIAFIFSLAKLSNRNLPFVIDTPLARLDSAHRLRLLADFLPSATHQVILFSTDTEVVGSLYERGKEFISCQYELADYNGGVTKPVQLAIAL